MAGGGGGGGGGGGVMLPQKMLKTGSPKMQFSVFWQLN